MNAIYNGHVMHRRLTPARHAFKYRVFALLLDLDGMDKLKLHLFARNRAAPISFHDCDHGDGRPLREWVSAKLAEANIEAGGPVRVLCYPRLFGFVFNPLSVWFCYSRDERLAAVIYEVHNTFGERHAYVLRVDGDSPEIRQACAKEFLVSPFLSMDCAYDFRIREPGEDVLIAINETEHGRPVLSAVFCGARQELSDRALASALLRHPLMTIKVVVAIHYEALRLWLKRVPSHVHHGAAAKGATSWQRNS